eukprot:2052545-Rhodomonas_salina.3
MHIGQPPILEHTLALRSLAPFQTPFQVILAVQPEPSAVEHAQAHDEVARVPPNRPLRRQPALSSRRLTSDPRRRKNTRPASSRGDKAGVESREMPARARRVRASHRYSPQMRMSRLSAAFKCSR